MYDRRSRVVIPTTRGVPDETYPAVASAALQIFSTIDLGPLAVVTTVTFSPKEPIEPKTYQLDLSRFSAS